MNRQDAKQTGARVRPPRVRRNTLQPQHPKTEKIAPHAYPSHLLIHFRRRVPV